MSNDELLDIVDENDNVIGQEMRSVCHSNPKLIHHTVHFTLIDPRTNKIFLHQRSFSKQSDPGKICFFGEHIQAGESYNKAIKRGVSEELGFNPKRFIELSTHKFVYDQQTEIVKFYLVIWEEEEIKIDQTEAINTFWYDQTELVKNMKTYSDITQHWAKLIDINKILLNTKQNG